MKAAEPIEEQAREYAKWHTRSAEQMNHVEAHFTAGADFMLEESNDKIVKLNEANDELTRQNKILREVLTASKAALIRLGEGKTANVFMINEALKSCDGGDNE